MPGGELESVGDETRYQQLLARASAGDLVDNALYHHNTNVDVAGQIGQELGDQIVGR